MALTTPLELEIRRRIASVLAGESSLRDFYRWFMPATWELESTGNPEALRLIHDITHLFSELSAGDLSHAEMLHELALAVSPKASSARHRIA
jgi:hypothetical protein